MKKVLALVVTAVMLMVCAAAVAEDAATTADANLVGVWYLNQVIDQGVAYDVSEIPDQRVIEFAADNTGSIYAKSNPEEKNRIAWTVDDAGIIWFQEESTQTPMQVAVNEDPNNAGSYYLMIGDENNAYIFSSNPTDPVEFAKIVKAEKAEDFDGSYALTYLAGEGYTLKAENALEDLAALGVKTTGVTIDTGMVELFGNEPRAYVFNEEDGTLNMIIEENLEFMNVHVFKTETGLAINWMDLTFYAEPVTAE